MVYQVDGVERRREGQQGSKVLLRAKMNGRTGIPATFRHPLARMVTPSDLEHRKSQSGDRVRATSDSLYSCVPLSAGKDCFAPCLFC